MLKFRLFARACVYAGERGEGRNEGGSGSWAVFSKCLRFMGNVEREGLENFNLEAAVVC